MDYSFETQRMAAAMEHQAQATEALAVAIEAMTVTNQRILELLLEVVLQDDPDGQPLTDMDGAPL